MEKRWIVYESDGLGGIKPHKVSGGLAADGAARWMFTEEGVGWVKGVLIGDLQVPAKDLRVI